ncbi:Transcriptional regulator ADR1 [Lachnellula suecica]|uniref:Transcriptional regulator ADR1 n=1 Tax=Lachnellula suecica TaxID=602035 RepID=A0A8T9BT70_9HELO|nr:Transcriptional regulator ADR1 [Lachnellula suecica]
MVVLEGTGAAAPAPVRGNEQGSLEKGKKRFQCQHCMRAFARLEHLQRHERIHTKDKPFGCRRCASHFGRRDLLIRHQRLTHSGNIEPPDGDDGPHPPSRVQKSPNKRRKTTFASDNRDFQDNQTLSSPLNIDQQYASSPSNSTFNPSTSLAHDGCSLATLSMAAEYTALQGTFTNASNITEDIHSLPSPGQPEATLAENLEVSESIPPHSIGFEESLENLAAFLADDAFSSYQFSSLMSLEQPMVLFSPESCALPEDMAPNNGAQAVSGTMQHQGHAEEPNSFSRFGSRLPSLQPEDSPISHLTMSKRLLSDVSSSDRSTIINKLSNFASVIPDDFVLPSRLALSRYIAAYISGFHEHLPFLHIPTMSIQCCSVELILAIAAVGAQYCFEGEKGVELFNVGQAIASFRIRRRDAGLATQSEQEFSTSNPGLNTSLGIINAPVECSMSGPLGLPSGFETSSMFPQEKEDLMQTAQALLILMAMATWAKHKKILREALAIQSILATLVRDDGLKSQPISDDILWEDWVRLETTKRTKLIVFCFFNLHCIVYNIPPLILNSEIKLALPSSAAEFKASNSAAWERERMNVPAETGFQEALRRLFTRSGRDIAGWNSSLGNYVLIHALIQHIFFVRQVAQCRFDRPGDLTNEDTSSLEHALRTWQAGWKRNPESSLDPSDPNGPVAFNSTALLRLAYIRLNINTGPYRSLDTRDPVQIANAFHESPPIQRTPKLVRAVLHSAHALSVPVKIGIRLVAKTQTFVWSIQHSLCSLECAFLLSKWLDAISLPNPDPPVTDDEWRISSLVKVMLDETEFAVPCDMPPDSPSTMKSLSAGVLRVWAAIFRGQQTWDIVDVIGTGLNIYADILDPCSSTA